MEIKEQQGAGEGGCPCRAVVCVRTRENRCKEEKETILGRLVSKFSALSY